MRKTLFSPSILQAGRRCARGIALGLSAVLAVPILGAGLLRAQTPPAATETHKAAVAPKTAQKHLGKHQGKRTSKARAKAVEPATAVTPAAPPAPDWPINDKPTPAQVTWDSRGLSVVAANSSLRQILSDVATATGAQVEGMGPDERVFGSYGPGLARDILTQLLHGSDYNVLLIGDQGQGAPRRIVLSAHGRSGAPVPVATKPAAEEDASADDEPDQQQQPPTPPPPPQVMRPGFNQEPPMRPPQMMPEMQPH